MRDDLEIPVAAGGPSYRVSRRPAAMDDATRRLLLIAGGVGAALILLIGGYTFVGHRSGGVPYVAAAGGPVRVKPEKPGGLEVLGVDEQGPGGEGREAMAAAPEAPDPRALRAASPVPAVGAPGPTASAAPPMLSAPPGGTVSPVAVGSAAAGVVGAAAGTAPSVARNATPATVPSPPFGAMQVQLAALASEEAAQAEWTRLSRRMPDLFGGRRPAITRTERDGKTYFRLRTGGFSDTAQAATFCQRVREKAGGCSIASF